MAGGGAGKVYFVLYLAVVLELLIIIVERDEAEEHLHQKQKEAMKIVESILSQLQAGSGTEQMNTKPKDEITIAPAGLNIKEVLGTDIKSSRKYTLLVGVTDVSREAKSKEGEANKEYIERLEKLVKQSNVEEIEYQIFYNPDDDPDNPPAFPTDEYIEENKWDFTQFTPGNTISTRDGEEWRFVGSQQLLLNSEKTFENVDPKEASKSKMHPVYDAPVINGEIMKPSKVESDSVFYYDNETTERLLAQSDGKGGISQRAFVLNFEPPSKAGWYKLRIYSRANKILGISSDVNANELENEMTVKVGTVNLKVKDLVKIKKLLQRDLDKYKLPKQEALFEAGGSKKFDNMIYEAQLGVEEDVEDVAKVRSSIKLYGYIVRLLTPGASYDFDQNKGSIEYDIRVLTPKPPIAEPVISFNDEIHAFDENQVNFRFSISPYRTGGQNEITGSVYDEVEGTAGAPLAKVNIKPISDAEPENGSSRAYIATIDKNLLSGENGTPRRYLVKMNHKLLSKSSDSTAVLTVYPAQNEEDVNRMNLVFNALATYGNTLFFNYQPPSGRNILPERFGYYFSTDADAQEAGLRPGFTAERSDGLVFPPEATEATLQIVYKDPISGNETEIFPAKTVPIRQDQPKISTNFAQVNVAGQDRLKVRISNITLKSPVTGQDGTDANITVNVEIDKVKVSDTYKAVGKPTYTIKDGKMTVQFDLMGDPDENGLARGTVDLRITALATNPINGKVSEAATKRYSARIKHKIEQEEYNPYDY